MKCRFTSPFPCGLHLLVSVVLAFLCHGHAAAETRVKTELYFCLSSPSGPVSDSAWHSFLNRYAAPAFSEGFTVVDAYGQWNDNGVSKGESSKVLIYYHADSETADTHIESVRMAYISLFDQQAVLRIDIPTGPAGEAGGENHLVPMLLALAAVLLGIQLYVLFRLRR